MPALERRRRFALWGLLAYGAVAAVILVSPVSPGALVDATGAWLRNGLGLDWFGQGWIEFIANIVLFLPVGALLTVLWQKPWHALAVAVMLSIAVELVQLLLPARLPSPRDILANATGAAIGVAGGWVIIRRPRRARPTATTPAR